MQHPRVLTPFLLAVTACASAGTPSGDDDSATPPDAAVIPPDAEPITIGPDADTTMPDAMPIPTPDASTPPPDACVATTQQLLTNGNVDAAPLGVNWTQLPQNASYPPISTAAEMSATGITPQSGGNAIWLGGWSTPSTDALYQQVAIPATTTSFHITGYRFYATAETVAGADLMRIQIRDTAGAVLETVKQWSNSDATTNWTFFDETVTGNYAGQTIRVYLESVLDNGENTNFFVDTLSVDVVACP